MNFLNLKISFRNLRRNRIYTGINLAGLGISTAFILLVIANIRHAFTVDRFNLAALNTYRIETNDSWAEADTTRTQGLFERLAAGSTAKKQLVTPAILADVLQKNFPEIKSTCRLRALSDIQIKVGNKKFKEAGRKVAFADRNFFEFFDLEMLNGQAFSEANNNSVVLSASAAKKYFGSPNCIGNTISINEGEDRLFTVSGVVNDFPSGSSMQFDVIFPVEGSSYYAGHMKEGTNSSSYLTLLQFNEGTDIRFFESKLAAFGERLFSDWLENIQTYLPSVREHRVGLSIRAFSDGHFNSSTPWFYFTDVKSLYQLIFLAFIALSIACLNFILLSLSRVAVRSHEAGVRRTVGAGWKHIVVMFLTETWVLVTLSMIFAFFLAFLALPYFNSLTGVDIPVEGIINVSFIGIAAILTILLTLVAGIYPAIKMAGIRPLSVLSKFGSYKLNPSLSRIFIGLQYTACVVLIVFTIVIARQIDFISNKDLGFDKEQTLIVGNPYWGDKQKTMLLRDQLYQFASVNPGLEGATGTSFKYAGGFNANGHFINGERTMISEMIVDFDYFVQNKIRIVEGRGFSKHHALDTMRLDISKEKSDSLGSKRPFHLVVNETLYKMLGRPPLNEVNRSLGGIIIGVSQDYFFQGLEQKIGPVYHVCAPGRLGYFWFKTSANQNMTAIAASVKQKFNELTNGEDFVYSFMDEDVQVLYESYARWLKIISSASWIAIFIACLGLFGLSAIVALNRTKEIGIRKVLGATVGQLFYALNRQTALIVLLSIAISTPVAIYVSDNWLQNFAYRIPLHWTFFVLASLVVLASALLAVSYHTLRVARNNPVKSLRTE